MSDTLFSASELEDFSWDKDTPEIDFFGEVVTNPNKDVTEEKEKKDVEEKETSTEEEGVSINFFEEEDTTEKEKEDLTEKNVTSNTVSTLNFLKEKGLVDFELEDDEELTEEKAEEILENSLEEKLESKLEETLKDLPESVKNLVRFTAKGGNPEDYFDLVSRGKEENISSKLDISKEENQVKFLAYKLREEGHDEDFIEEHIEFLKDRGTLEKVASKSFTSWKEEKEEEEAIIVEKQKEVLKKTREKQVQYKKDIASTLSSNTDLKGLKITKQDVKELPEYISSPTVKLEDGRQITPFYKDLFEAIKDPNKVAILAKLVKNDFDFKDIKAKAATETTIKVKEDLQRQKEKNKTIGSAGGSSQTKRLADYF